MASVIRQTCLITLFITQVLIVLYKRQTLWVRLWLEWLGSALFLMALRGASFGGSPALWCQRDAPTKIQPHRKTPKEVVMSGQQLHEQRAECELFPSSMWTDICKDLHVIWSRGSEKHIYKVWLKYHPRNTKPNPLFQILSKQILALLSVWAICRFG